MDAWLLVRVLVLNAALLPGERCGALADAHLAAGRPPQRHEHAALRLRDAEVALQTAVQLPGAHALRARPEDAYLGNLLGRSEARAAGVTTMLDWFHCADRPENADAAIEALRAAPGRSIFCYGAGTPAEPDITPEITRVRSRLPDDGMVLGLRGPQLTTMATTAAAVALARELGLRVS